MNRYIFLLIIVSISSIESKIDLNGKKILNREEYIKLFQLVTPDYLKEFFQNMNSLKLQDPDLSEILKITKSLKNETFG